MLLKPSSFLGKMWLFQSRELPLAEAPKPWGQEMQNVVFQVKFMCEKGPGDKFGCLAQNQHCGV